MVFGPSGKTRKCEFDARPGNCKNGAAHNLRIGQINALK